MRLQAIGRFVLEGVVPLAAGAPRHARSAIAVRPGHQGRAGRARARDRRLPGDDSRRLRRHAPRGLRGLLRSAGGVRPGRAPDHRPRGDPGGVLLPGVPVVRADAGRRPDRGGPRDPPVRASSTSASPRSRPSARCSAGSCTGGWTGGPAPSCGAASPTRGSCRSPSWRRRDRGADRGLSSGQGRGDRGRGLRGQRQAGPSTGLAAAAHSGGERPYPPRHGPRRRPRRRRHAGRRPRRRAPEQGLGQRRRTARPDPGSRLEGRRCRHSLRPRACRAPGRRRTASASGTARAPACRHVSTSPPTRDGLGGAARHGLAGRPCPHPRGAGG